MWEDDFLMKQLSQLITAVVNRSQEAVTLRKQALDLKARGEHDTALHMLDDALEHCSGLTPDLYQRFPETTVAAVLSINSDMNQLLDTAGILRDKASIYLDMGDDANAAKALQIAAKLMEGMR